jgi:hypothetical protein
MSIFDDMEKQNLISFGHDDKLYSHSNSLENIADFEYILKCTQPIDTGKAYWTLKGVNMIIAGGSRLINC